MCESVCARTRICSDMPASVGLKMLCVLWLLSLSVRRSVCICHTCYVKQFESLEVIRCEAQNEIILNEFNFGKFTREAEAYAFVVLVASVACVCTHKHACALFFNLCAT